MGRHALEHIACITDLTAQTLPAFHHALALALAHRTRLTLLYVGPEHRNQVDWAGFPRVRDTLERWGRLPADCDQTRVAEQLGVDVRKQAFRDRSPLQGLKAFVRQHPADLVVTCMTRNGRLQGLLQDTGAEGLVDDNLAHMLLLPPGARDFVDADSGAGRLARTLLPVASTPDPATALRVCESVLPALAQGPLDVTLFHIGDQRTAPDLAPLQGQARWQWRFGEGSQVAEQVLAEVAKDDSDLVVLPGSVRRGLWQRLRPSVTRQVLHQSRQPVLVVAAS